MKEKVFMIVLVVSIGILLGVLIVNKESGNLVYKELLQKQEEILDQQNYLAQQIQVIQKNMSTQQNFMQEKLVSIDSQVQNVSKVFSRQAAQAPQQPPPEDFTIVYDIPIDHTPIIGKKDAPITITVFTDFQCPFCGRFHPPILEVLKTYPNDVRFIVKNFPLGFHPNARPAAKAALAANEQGKYQEMVDELFKNQQNLTEEKFQEIAKQIGLDVKKFIKDYKEQDAKWEDMINKDMELGQKVGVRGTPTFFLNGKKTRARDFATYKTEIDAILNNK